MSKTKKVLVVGAGPGGSSAAYFLKHFDKEDSLDVDLIDKLADEKFVRYHDMCGEGINEELIKEIYPLKPQGLVKRVHTYIEHYPGNISIKTEKKGYLIDRSIFLKSIIKEFQNNEGRYKTDNLISINQSKDKIKVKLGKSTNNYDYVIGADGPNSVIREYFGLKARKRHFTQYILEKKPQNGILRFYYDEKYKGDYKWEFPHETNVKIGFPSFVKNNIKIREKILVKQSKFISYGGLNKYVIGRVLLVGDAAAQTNAITKGGIRSAMIAGKMAAKAVVNNNPVRYEQEWNKTQFSSKIFLEAFEKLQTMDNKELQKHIEPFRGRPTIFTNLSLLLFYRKYLKLYKSYDLANEVGW